MPEAQAKFRWTPPVGTLGGIVAEANGRAQALLQYEQEWKTRAAQAGQRPPFYDALRGDRVAVIAEVKRQSPSKGVINAAIDAVAQAKAYAAGGAAAISVLTEPKHFGGSADDLVRVTQAVSIPALKKDFHVHPIQMYEARALGASAALLIARAVRPDLLIEMVKVARDLELETLVEIRTERELETALAANATVIGVNNRDLETLVIDDTTAERIIPLIPESAVAVAESGMRVRADVERAAAFGSSAVLIGSAISSVPDPLAAVAGLVGVQYQHGRRVHAVTESES